MSADTITVPAGRFDLNTADSGNITPGSMKGLLGTLSQASVVSNK